MEYLNQVVSVSIRGTDKYHLHNGLVTIVLESNCTIFVVCSQSYWPDV